MTESRIQNTTLFIAERGTLRDLRSTFLVFICICMCVSVCDVLDLTSSLIFQCKVDFASGKSNALC